MMRIDAPVPGTGEPVPRRPGYSLNELCRLTGETNKRALLLLAVCYDLEVTRTGKGQHYKITGPDARLAKFFAAVRHLRAHVQSLGEKPLGRQSPGKVAPDSPTSL